MCGINGVWSRSNQINLHDFDAMRDTLIHRGPDGAGTKISDSGKLALGHRRLAFMDLSETGGQPLVSESKEILASVNGEIYNYQELKHTLQELGYNFTTKSDSEVIIHGWIEWGEKLPQKLNGMFAFAVWDNRTKSLFLARDRFGIKPLYYYFTDEEFAFASELKALVKWNINIKKVDIRSMANFFTYRYVPSPNTIYKDVFKIPPAHSITVNRVNEVSINRYWDITDVEIGEIDKESSIMEQTDVLLNESVKMHMQSDVPVGAFLSGGYDSSALVASLFRSNSKINTFSIGFKNWEQSEHQYAEIVANKFEMPFYSKVLDDVSLNLLDSLMYFYDEPIADISIIPTYEVSKLASSKNKAVISGEGADELFVGYTWHYENLELERKQRLFRTFYKKDNKAFSVEAYSNAMAMGHLRTNELKELFVSDLHKYIPNDSDWFYRENYKKELSGLNRFRYLDIKCFMGELVLTKVDRASMANSLEVRVPFLENKLSCWLFNLPKEKLYKAENQKILLHQIIEPYLPEEILKRKKQGFVGPDKYYFNENWYSNIVESSTLVEDNVLELKTLNKWLSDKEFWKLWKFAVMEHWYRKWIKN